jgi:hypothetical protein
MPARRRTRRRITLTQESNKELEHYVGYQTRPVAAAGIRARAGRLKLWLAADSAVACERLGAVVLAKTPPAGGRST